MKKMISFHLFHLANVGLEKEHCINKMIHPELVGDDVGDQDRVNSEQWHKNLMFSDNLIFWIQLGCFHEINSHTFFD